jgi:drug/metabolite transporter (DMT)-like permease
MSDKAKAIALLLTASFIWGISFPMNRLVLERVGPFGYSALRYLFGALALAPAALRWGRRAAQSSYFPQARKGTWVWGGFLAGAILAAGNGIQYYGLAQTMAAKAGFINGLYVAMVPLFGLILGVVPSRLVWAGLVASVLGLFFVSGPGSAQGFNRGDAYVLVANLFWAAHVFVLGHYTVRVSPWRFVFGQAAFGCAISFLLAELTGSWPAWAQFKAIWPFALWGAVSVGGAYVCQALAQRKSTPTSAALVMQSQSVVAAASGALILGETLTPWMALGAVFLIGGSAVAQLGTASQKLSPSSPHYRGWQTARVLVALLILAACGLAVAET